MDKVQPYTYCHYIHQDYLQSKVHKHTLHPEFEEEFIFELTPSQLASAVLDVQVLNSDGSSKDDVLGQVLLQLDNINLTEPVVLWKGLSHCDKKQEVMREIYGDIYLLSAVSNLNSITYNYM